MLSNVGKRAVITKIPELVNIPLGTVVDVKEYNSDMDIYRIRCEDMRVTTYVKRDYIRVLKSLDDATVEEWDNTQLAAWNLKQKGEAEMGKQKFRSYLEKFDAAVTTNKYRRTVQGENANGEPVYISIDVYDVLEAFDVTNSAYQHLIKKALCTGIRGHKSAIEDANDIVESALRGREIVKKKVKKPLLV